jgi:hypothetical protein
MSAPATAGPVLQGVLLESKPDMAVIGLPGTDYRLHLALASPLSAPLNKPIRGTIYARAKRVDKVPSGGRFVEPVYGRPRRLQGRVIATDTGHNTITVNAGAPFVCELTMDQKADGFAEGDLVSFDVERGARFEPASH